MPVTFGAMSGWSAGGDDRRSRHWLSTSDFEDL
jgi:hypothetical protein